MPLIIPANTLSAAGYEVANSCRFDGSSSYMTKTPGSAGSQVTQTYSVWVKRSKLGDEEFIMYARKDADDDTRLYFENDTLRFQCTVNNTTHTRLWTNRVFRDPSAWYHIVISYDSSVSTPSTSSVQMFINGVKETSFSATIYPSQNDVSYWCDDSLHTIGRRSDGTSNYYNGYMAEAVLIDGSALTASSFGEFDEDSPQIWKPKDVSGLTFGTNGFYLDFEDSANLGNDANGGTDFTETNLAATDQATDTPTNSFATLNPLDNYYAESTFSEGNCKVAQGASTYAWNLSTIAVTAGKYYAEAKITTDSEHALVGITDQSPVRKLNDILGSDAYDYSIKFANGDLFNNRGTDPANDATTYAAAFAQNDIIGIALDCDNNKLYFSKGGAWSDGSGSWDSTTFDAAVGAVTITAPASTNNGHYFFASGDYGGAVCTWEWNFGGCPAFSISSGNADANGYGNFEYAVPSGFLALNTKNLGSDGG